MIERRMSWLWLLATGCLELPVVPMVPDAEPEPAPPEERRIDEAPPMPTLWVRAPSPGRSAPLNLHWLYVELQPIPATMPHEITLVSDTATVVADVVAVAGGGLLASLPPHHGPCRSLCPHTAYRLEADTSLLRSIGGVETATVVDLLPPTLTSSQALIVGDTLELDLTADEPIVAAGTITDRDGHVVALSALPFVGHQLRVRATEELPAETQVWLTIFIEDAAGNPGPTLQLALVTPPRLDVRIQELVATPLHDWSDSEAGLGVPFDPNPGAGTVSSADEWVELVNFGRRPIDLYEAGLELRGIDGTPGLTQLAGAPGLYFGSGGDKTSWWPGEALVVRTRGDMAQQGLALELWSNRRQLDRWLIGSDPMADHPGGSPPDGAHEAIARTVTGRLRWCVPTPGDPVPASDCR